MAKIYKISGYVVDPNDEFKNVTYYLDYIKNRNKSGAYEICFSGNTSEEFEWDDDLEINSIYCTEEDCEKYFK